MTSVSRTHDRFTSGMSPGMGMAMLEGAGPPEGAFGASFGVGAGTSGGATGDAHTHAHAHSHGPGETCSHGHSHGEGDAHGHSHGGAEDHGHGHSHGHSHGHGHGHSHGAPEGATLASRMLPVGPRSGGGITGSIRGVFAGLVYYLPVLLNQSSTRLTVLFMLLELALIVVEVGYGLWSNSLGLLADAAHHGLDVSMLAVSLLAVVLGRQQATFAYTYGYDRAEVLAGFTVASTLAFVCLYLMIEVVERLMEAADVAQHHIIPVALASLAVNVCRFFFLKGYAHGRSETSSGSTRAPQQSPAGRLAMENASSLALICSAVLMEWGMQGADVLATLWIVGLIMYAVVPLTRDTGRVLLQATPLSIQGLLDKCLHEASTLDGVLECQPNRCHFWTQAPGVFCGNITVRVRADANEQVVLAHVHRMFRPFVAHLTIQIEKNEW